MPEPRQPGAHRPEGRPPERSPIQRRFPPNTGDGRQLMRPPVQRLNTVHPLVVQELEDGLVEALGINELSPGEKIEIRKGTSPVHLITRRTVLNGTGQTELTREQWEAIKAGADPVDIIGDYNSRNQAAGSDSTMQLPPIADPRKNSTNR